MNDSHQITLLLKDWNNGNQTALDKLIPLVYAELHQIARRYMSKQSADHTMQTTELIHEAYLKLAGNDEQDWENRSHFYGVAAQAMRHILVDYARMKSRKKRGGWQERITLTENLNPQENHLDNIIALDEALRKLSEFNERKAKTVELKYFGGMTLEEIAEVLDVSVQTAFRDWRFSRMWLLKELSGKQRKPANKSLSK